MGNNPQLTPDLIIQYTVVGIVLLLACGWIFWKIFRKQKEKNRGGCCGCAIADTCKKAKKNK